MKTIELITAVAALLLLGYISLKEGLHIETEEEKMYKVLHPPKPTFRHYPKWYAVLIGIMCFSFAFYFAMNFLLSLF